MRFNWCRVVIIIAVSAVFCLASMPSRAQKTEASQPQAQTQDKPWSATGEADYASGLNPTRTSESHKVIGNRTVDKRSMQRLGPDGRYENYQDVETETIKVNATTTRTITRTYGWDSSGTRRLVQVSEEENKELAGGAARRSRTISNPDTNGGLQVVQSEVEETRKPRADVTEVQRTVSLPDGSGGLSPASRTVERQTKTSEDSSRVSKTIEQRNGLGGWQTVEASEGVIKESGTQRTSEETVSRIDENGKLSVAAKTVSKDVTDATGQSKSTVETYSKEIPGGAPDTSLHLNQRVTTIKKQGPGGSKTQQQVEDRDPGDPSGGMRVSSRIIDIVRSGPNGQQQTRTIEALGGEGLNVVEVDTRKSNQAPVVKVDIAPAEKAQADKSADKSKVEKPK